MATSTVSRIFTAWVNFMFAQINTWPSREAVTKTMPEVFKDNYPSMRVIIDCTEIKCEMPSSLLLNTELFSSYKNHDTSRVDWNGTQWCSNLYKPVIYRQHLG